MGKLHVMVILSMMFHGSHALYFQPSEVKEILSETSEAAEAVLNASGSRPYSTIIMTDGTTHSTTMLQFIEKLEIQLGVGLFEVPVASDNTTLPNLSSALLQMYQIHQSSMSLNVVIASDNTYFLASTITSIRKDGLLVWPTKLLVISRLPALQLHQLGKDLSTTNSLMIIVEGTAISKRCGIYSYMPYSIRLLKVATWTQERGIIYISDHGLFPDKFTKLPDGGNLLLTGEEYPPHLKVEDIPNEAKWVGKFSGPIMKLLSILALSLNFTYSLVRPLDRSWGYRENGSWNGMMGMVFREEVDFGLGPFGLTLTRAQAVDYTSALLVDYVRIAARRGQTEVDPWGFMLPLTFPVWICTFLAGFLVMAVSLFLPFFMIAPKDISYKDSIFNVLRILLQQAADISIVNGWSERTLIAGWLMTTLVLARSFSGNLVSLLSVRYVAQPYQTLRDVVDDTSITMLWEANTGFLQHIYNAESGIFLDVAETRKHNRLLYLISTEYPMAMENQVLNGDHVLMIEDLALKMLLAEHFTKTGSCKFYLSREMFIPFAFGMIVQKHSPLRPSISKRIIAVTESGIYDYWLKNAVPNSTSCLNAPTKIAVQSTLAIRNLWGMFVILAGGYIISLLVLCLELGHAHIFPSSLYLFNDV